MEQINEPAEKAGLRVPGKEHTERVFAFPPQKAPALVSAKPSVAAERKA